MPITRKATNAWPPLAKSTSLDMLPSMKLSCPTPYYSLPLSPPPNTNLLLPQQLPHTQTSTSAPQQSEPMSSVSPRSPHLSPAPKHLPISQLVPPMSPNLPYLSLVSPVSNANDESCFVAPLSALPVENSPSLSSNHSVRQSYGFIVGLVLLSV